MGLNSLPCELLVLILKELRSLESLQAAILTSRGLLEAFRGYRKRILQQVFWQETWDRTFHDPRNHAYDLYNASDWFSIDVNATDARISALGKKHHHDELILRDCSPCIAVRMLFSTIESLFHSLHLEIDCPVLPILTHRRKVTPDVNPGTENAVNDRSTCFMCAMIHNGVRSSRTVSAPPGNTAAEGFRSLILYPS